MVIIYIVQLLKKRIFVVKYRFSDCTIFLYALCIYNHQLKSIGKNVNFLHLERRVSSLYWNKLNLLIIVIVMECSCLLSSVDHVKNLVMCLIYWKYFNIKLSLIVVQNIVSCWGGGLLYKNLPLFLLSSTLKPLCQFQWIFAWIVLRWSSFKLISDRS